MAENTPRKGKIAPTRHVTAPSMQNQNNQGEIVRRISFAAAVLAGCSVPVAAVADREPVLQQIDVPHHYYFREMYLPQLTSGPGSLAWSPDGQSLVYSMQGSLWVQALGSDTAMQLTAGPGYDYQPDWSPDGSQVVFTRYADDALELYLVDMETRDVTRLTDDGAVNVEPRWSPDGTRLAFVSTRDTGRFHVFTGELVEAELQASPVFGERQSDIGRYYYSRFDHELSPAWSPDGQSLVFVSNPETPYGTGPIWRKRLDSDEPPALVRQEETSWRARPDWAPDGRRIAYASYLGRQWHQLWVTMADSAAEPFPLTYGDFDVSGARFSPDGERIAYVVNEAGNTEIRIQELVGGRVSLLPVNVREYLHDMAEIEIEVVDERGQPLPARIAIRGSDGRSYAPHDAWIHADDGFDRGVSDFEAQYFHATGPVSVAVPPGATRITSWHGFEHEISDVLINAQSDAPGRVTVTMTRLALPDEWARWRSADVHVHMNYGGTYRNTPANLVQQAKAEDLDVVFNLIVNKEQRIPDIRYFSPDPDSASDDRLLLMHAQEYHTSFWGHLGLIGLDSHLLLPDYAAYPGTAAASLFPDNATVARLARAQNAAVGYVHPFEPPAPDPRDGATSLTNALPVDAALGLVDYYEVVGFADPHTSAEVWYGLLNCGLRIAAAGGTDAMANYASLRGPVGINRTYVLPDTWPQDPAARQAAWLAALRADRTLATNGPLIGLTVDGEPPGAEIAAKPGDTLNVRGFLRSQVPLDHLELVQNGEVVRAFDMDAANRNADFEETVTVEQSGWLLLRAWRSSAHPHTFDLYPYATTSPVYISVDGQAPRSDADAEYFLAWLERVREAAAAHPDYFSDRERDLVLANIDAARERFAACRAPATR